MKKNNIVLFGIAVLCACSVPKERQPLTGGQWGEIKNGSAEEVVSSEVLYWQAPPASKEVLHFYDATAHDGTRSLCISADGLRFTRLFQYPLAKPSAEIHKLRVPS